MIQMPANTTIEDRLAAVAAGIRRTTVACGRSPDDVRLLAVSKTFPVADILRVAAAGQRDFAESWFPEAADKTDALAGRNLCWHFVGPIQGNKTRAIAERFDWVHSIDRIRIAQRLSDQRPDGHPPLQVCIQINLDDEASKSGVTPGALAELTQAVCKLPNLELRGLMAIPRRTLDPTRQREGFARLRTLLESLRSTVTDADTLSMGMTDDLEAAIMEGATMVRVGSGIFGDRPR